MTLFPLVTPTENLLPFDGEAYLFEQFFLPKAADIYFEELKANIVWKQEPIKMFGKLIMQPRLTAWYGDSDKPYSYSGITMQPQAWSPLLLDIKTQIETQANTTYSSVLLNRYRDGNDSMGWHSDDERELGRNPNIGSVSFGTTRTFQFRHRTQRDQKVTIQLPHGSFLLMTGETQHYWHHQIPKSTKINSERINLTFRKILEIH